MGVGAAATGRGPVSAGVLAAQRRRGEQARTREETSTRRLASAVCACASERERKRGERARARAKFQFVNSRGGWVSARAQRASTGRAPLGRRPPTQRKKKKRERRRALARAHNPPSPRRSPHTNHTTRLASRLPCLSSPQPQPPPRCRSVPKAPGGRASNWKREREATHANKYMHTPQF